MSIVKIAKRKDVTLSMTQMALRRKKYSRGNVIRQNLSAVLYSPENL